MKNVKNIISLVLVIVFAVFVSNYEENTQAANMSVPMVSVSGESFGVKMHTAGVLIISTGEVKTEKGVETPAKNLGLNAGDLITEINNKKVKSCAEVSQIIEKSQGKELIITFERNSQKKSVSLRPVLSEDSGTYKAGLWIRDSSAGIGTVTFYKKGGEFASLGHGVNDVDTHTLLPLDNGEAMSSDIIGFSRAEKGKAGELYGVLGSDKIGDIKLNTENGVYGKTNADLSKRQFIPTASAKQIKRGKATLLTTIDGEGVKEFEVNISFISRFSTSSKDMIIKVTDKALLQKTGGILQGMSGSPIIQNGRFVGALTHVFLNKPDMGYAIFGYKMVNIASQM